jgi:hypothetical protein
MINLSFGILKPHSHMSVWLAGLNGECKLEKIPPMMIDFAAKLLPAQEFKKFGNAKVFQSCNFSSTYIIFQKNLQ